jgi:hypothetical protein
VIFSNRTADLFSSSKSRADVTFSHKTLLLTVPSVHLPLSSAPKDVLRDAYEELEGVAMYNPYGCSENRFTSAPYDEIIGNPAEGLSGGHEDGLQKPAEELGGLGR